MTASDDLEGVVERSHLSLGEFMKGDPEPLKRLFSQRDDVTLANPYGPAVRGWKQVAATMERAATHYQNGDAVAFERIATYSTTDLACIVEVERLRAKVAGGENIVPVVLRVTSVLRPEDGTWRIVHRHADPITTVQPVESVIQKR